MAWSLNYLIYNFYIDSLLLKLRYTVKRFLVNTGSGHNMSPDGTEPQPDPTLTIDLRYPNMILENTWNISDNLMTYPTGESVNEAFFPK